MVVINCLDLLKPKKSKPNGSTVLGGEKYVHWGGVGIPGIKWTWVMEISKCTSTDEWGQRKCCTYIQ